MFFDVFGQGVLVRRSPQVSPILAFLDGQQPSFVFKEPQGSLNRPDAQAGLVRDRLDLRIALSCFLVVAVRQTKKDKLRRAIEGLSPGPFGHAGRH
jgi:hypothetical protein